MCNTSQSFGLKGGKFAAAGYYHNRCRSVIGRDIVMSCTDLSKYCRVISGRLLHVYFFNCNSGGWSPIRSTNRPIVPAPGHYDDGEIGGMIRRGNRSTRRKTCPSVVLSTTNPTCCPDANPGRRGGKPATNRLRYGTTLVARYVLISLKTMVDHNVLKLRIEFRTSKFTSIRITKFSLRLRFKNVGRAILTAMVMESSTFLQFIYSVSLTRQ
jgi:hypothetical protein